MATLDNSENLLDVLLLTDVQEAEAKADKKTKEVFDRANRKIFDKLITHTDGAPQQLVEEAPEWDGRAA